MCILIINCALWQEIEMEPGTAQLCSELVRGGSGGYMPFACLLLLHLWAQLMSCSESVVDQIQD